MSYHRLDIVISGAISPYLKLKPGTMPLDHVYYIVLKFLCLSAGLSLWQQVLKMHYARYPAKGNRGGSLISPISAKQSTKSHFRSSLRPRPSEDQPRYRASVSKSSTVPLSLIMKLRAMGCYNSKPISLQNGSCFALCSIVHCSKSHLAL